MPQNNTLKGDRANSELSGEEWLCSKAAKKAFHHCNGVQSLLAERSPQGPAYTWRLWVTSRIWPQKLRPSCITVVGSCCFSSVLSQQAMPSCGYSMALLATYSCVSTTLMLWLLIGWPWFICSLTFHLFCPSSGSWTTGASGMLSSSGQPLTALALG